MATIVRREIRKRGFIGKICVAIFWAFNLLMAYILVRYLFHEVPRVEAMKGQPGVGGSQAAVVTISFFILGAWGFGDIVLGMFVLMTRGNVTVIEEIAENLPKKIDPTF